MMKKKPAKKMAMKMGMPEHPIVPPALALGKGLTKPKKTVKKKKTTFKRQG